MFTSNLHSIDRILRIVIGLVLISLIFIGPKTLWGFSGVILVLTAYINFCPLYSILGFSTRSK